MITTIKGISTVLFNTSKNVINFFRPPQYPQFALAGLDQTISIPPPEVNSAPTLTDCLWLAVPKRKVTRSKKRMKTTNQKRIKPKEHIIVDKRTGELTLRHRLPFNWKDYLPETTG